MEKKFFVVEAREHRARAGVLHTPHGEIHTPAFIPVGTKASVKGVHPDNLKTLQVQAVLANVYHLYLSPGERIIEKAGGVASFMNWNGPTFTDSGGFQVFSLGKGMKRRISQVSEEDKSEKADTVVFDDELSSQHGQLAIIDEEGVSFTSHLDGTLHRLTPERSVELQHALGADIFFAFDHCTSPTDSYDYQKDAMYRTHRWADRSLKAHQHNLNAKKKQAIYGIAQGGQFEDLRRESTKTISSMGFDGFGLGGAFTKKNGESMLSLALSCLNELPPEMPVHGLGVGEPTDILQSIASGVDTFDCVDATRRARHGMIYTKEGIINLKSEKYKEDMHSLDELFIAPGTEGFTRAYVAHLLRTHELLGIIITSLHNISFITSLVDGARKAIYDNKFEAYREAFLTHYRAL